MKDYRLQAQVKDLLRNLDDAATIINTLVEDVERLEGEVEFQESFVTDYKKRIDELEIELDEAITNSNKA